MITKLLSTAVKLYLRSQVSRVEDLQVKISGKNRQILKGYIPEVFLSCQRAIYQGLHLQEVVIEGTNIAVNLSEVLKKKPLRLLEPIIVEVRLALDGKDLSSSLDSALLQSGLSDLWQIILAANKETSINSQLINSNIVWHNIAIADNELKLSGIYIDNSGKNRQLNLSTGINLINSHTLGLFPLKINYEFNVEAELVDKLEIDLGTDINIENLVVQSEQILCSGNITVNN